MTKARNQEPSWQEVLPAKLRALLGQADWEAISIGRSMAHVFHIEDGYLKIMRQGQAQRSTLQAEKERLEWLEGRLPVPQVYYYGRNAFFEYLYLSEIQGIMACDQQFRDDIPRLIDMLAEALHMVHAVGEQSCPFTRPLKLRLEEMQHNIAGGHFDAAKFALDHQGVSPQAWYDQLEYSLPAFDNLSFTHGDFCLPNIMIDRKKMRISGLLDWGGGGIADRHEDLAAACWSLGYNFDQAWIPSLLEAYGRESIDQKRLTFYQRLDDLSHYYLR
jgi:aminoglycoside phosphotransferase